MSRVPTDAAAQRYVTWWESLPQTLHETEAVFAPDGRFVDPFSDIRGAARIRQHLARAYERLHDVRITVTDQAFSGRVAYLRWTFGFRLGRGRAVREIIGMSEVHIDDEGRVTLHFDHWDAASQIYEAIPLLGNLLRKIKRRING